METLLLVMQIAALGALAALCVTLIVLVLRLKDFLSVVERDLKEITGRTLPVLDNMEVITARVKGMTENIEDQLQAVRDSFVSVKSVADNIVSLERRVQERVEGPILDSLAYVSAVIKGVRTFVQRVRA